MKKIAEEIVDFFYNQSFVIVSTLGIDKIPHTSCKGIVEIDPKGLIYLLDLYRGQTYENLKHHKYLSITAVDEHRFKGYCLKGEVKSIREEDITDKVIEAWGNRVTSRITQRLLRNMHGEKGHSQHPEILLPKPEFMIIMQVEEIVDLKPQHIRE